MDFRRNHRRLDQRHDSILDASPVQGQNVSAKKGNPAAKGSKARAKARNVTTKQMATNTTFLDHVDSCRILSQHKFSKAKSQPIRTSNTNRTESKWNLMGSTGSTGTPAMRNGRHLCTHVRVQKWRRLALVGLLVAWPLQVM